jgi:membrane protein YqaA with SNARE-associated domain
MEIKVHTPSRKERMKDWFVRKAHHKHSGWWLAFFAFIESSFFPIPPDLFLIGLLAVRKAKNWLYFSLVTAGSSIAGGVLGYVIGAVVFSSIGDQIISFYGLTEQFAAIGNLYADNAFWAVFTSAFTPIPFKVFTLSAGFFNVSFPIFLLASALGRVLRFVAVGVLMKIFNKTIAHIAYKYFNWIGVAVAMVVVIYIIIRTV